MRERLKRFGFTLSICCQVAKVHIAFLFSVYVHSLKKKKIIEMALKTKQETPPSCDKYLEWIQLYSFVTHLYICSIFKQTNKTKY